MGANSIALEHSRRNSVGRRFFVLIWGIRSICVSAEERSCLDGVYTVRSQPVKSLQKRLYIVSLARFEN